MSQENVEIVRRVYDGFRHFDWDKVERFADPDLELHGTSGGLFDGSVARGTTAVRETFEAWDAEAWEEVRLTPREFVDAGDRVVVLQNELRRGRGSGVEVRSETAVLFELRDGRVVRVQGFMDQGEALRAAGLRE
jgi:ketosteroid isomerase-like protein